MTVTTSVCASRSNSTTLDTIPDATAFSKLAVNTACAASTAASSIALYLAP